jgi:hypothetical protein
MSVITWTPESELDGGGSAPNLSTGSALAMRNATAGRNPH